MPFVKATKKQAKARIGIIGPSGSGKTYTALLLASGLGSKIAVIDTEHGSASKYADEFEFDVMELDTYNPQNYIDGIIEAGKAGYDVLIIDSLSHAWAGTEGALELADKNASKYGGNRFAAWRDVTPLHNKLIETMLSSPLHLIATMRSKMEYIQTQDDKGRTIIKKVGMAPIQRDGMEYEFDIVGDMDLDHNFIISKTRCRALDGMIVQKPGRALADTIKAWLSDGAPVQATPAPQARTAVNRPEPTPEPQNNVVPLQTKPLKNIQPKETQAKNGAYNWTKIWAPANEAGWTNDDVHAFTGLASLKDMPTDWLNNLANTLTLIKNAKISPEEAKTVLGDSPIAQFQQADWNMLRAELFRFAQKRDAQKKDTPNRRGQRAERGVWPSSDSEAAEVIIDSIYADDNLDN